MDLFKKLMKMNLPLIIGLITELVVIYKGENNIMTNYIGLKIALITVALITVAGSILKSQIRKLEEEKEQTNEKEDDFEL